MNRLATSLSATALLSALILVPATAASAETVDGCAAVQVAPLDQELVAGSAAENNFVFAAPDSTSAELGNLQAGKSYRGTTAFRCADSFYSSFRAVELGAQRVYVSSSVVAEVTATDDLNFDAYVAVTAALSFGAKVYSQPSNGSDVLGELAGETVYPSTSITKAGPSSLLGSGDYHAVQFNGETGWVDSSAVSLVSADKFDVKATPKPKASVQPASAAEPTSSAKAAAKPSRSTSGETQNLWPLGILGSLVIGGGFLVVSRRRKKTKGPKSKPTDAPEEPTDD